MLLVATAEMNINLVLVNFICVINHVVIERLVMEFAWITAGYFRALR